MAMASTAGSPRFRVAVDIGGTFTDIVFLDVDGFWSSMEAFLDQAVASGVLRAEVRGLFRTAPSAGAALDVLAAW